MQLAVFAGIGRSSAENIKAETIQIEVVQQALASEKVIINESVTA